MRYYSNQAISTTLTASVDSATTSLSVTDITGFPSAFPYTLILDQGQATEEIVEVSGASGSILQVLRGIDGSTAMPHASNASVVHGVSARDYRESRDHESATTGVHGLTTGSSVVGTTDTQILTNKTLSSPVIDRPTFTNTVIDGSLVGKVASATAADSATTATTATTAGHVGASYYTTRAIAITSATGSGGYYYLSGSLSFPTGRFSTVPVMSFALQTGDGGAINHGILLLSVSATSYSLRVDTPGSVGSATLHISATANWG